MIVIASLLGLAMAIIRKDATYLFVLVWSFIGIGIKQTAVPDVVVSAWVAAGLMLGLAVYSLMRRRTQ